MGNGLFHNEQKYRQIFKLPEIAQYEDQLDDLGLSAYDIFTFYSIFVRMKNYSGFDVAVLTGSIMMYFKSDYFRGLAMKNLPLLALLLSSHSSNENEKFTFYEFVDVMWQFLTCQGHNLIARIVFDCYAQHKHKDQIIPGKDFLKMIKDLSGEFMDGFDPADAKAAEMDALNRRMDNRGIAFSEFLEFCSDHQSLLNPAKRLQLQLRHRVLGTGAWKRLIRNRAKKDVSFRLESDLGAPTILSWILCTSIPLPSSSAGMSSRAAGSGGIVVPSNEPGYEEMVLKELKLYFDDMNLGVNEQLSLFDYYKGFDPKHRREVDIIYFEKQHQFQLSTGLPPGVIFCCLHEPREIATTVDFLKFAVLAWDLCTGGRAAVGRVAFLIYDRDRNGSIDTSDAKQMLSMVLGKKYEQHPTGKEVLEACKTTPFTPYNFEKYILGKPDLILPIEKLQAALKVMILGAQFWERVEAVRPKNSTLTAKNILKRQVVVMGAGLGRRSTREGSMLKKGGSFVGDRDSKNSSKSEQTVARLKRANSNSSSMKVSFSTDMEGGVGGGGGGGAISKSASGAHIAESLERVDSGVTRTNTNTNSANSNTSTSNDGGKTSRRS